jgi:3,4-dihydroxy 2-butanone 4-phosphate synthase / GTP cyclohydrolase II
MKNFEAVEQALDDFKRGKMIVVVDNEERENEGDLMMAAELVRSEDITFMAREGRGLICAPLSTEIASRLNLNLMEKRNGSIHETAFTISVDAIGTGTGISSDSRAKTVRALANEFARAEDFLRPGHIFPLIARDGGVLERPGHTEATVDLCKLAGLKEVGLICEIVGDDGSMLRGQELQDYAVKHQLKFLAIDQLILYIKEKKRLLHKTSEIDFPNDFGHFRLHLFENQMSEHHFALSLGDLKESHEGILLRIHSECLTGDVFGSMRCDCGDQLTMSMREIAKAGKGLLIYLKQEGRGIGFVNKIKAYKLQEKGFDTVSANHELGFEADLRDFTPAIDILDDLGVKKVKLLTNNLNKVNALRAKGIEVIERLSIDIEPSEHNRNYLQTKRDKLGHFVLNQIH